MQGSFWYEICVCTRCIKSLTLIQSFQGHCCLFHTDMSVQISYCRSTCILVITLGPQIPRPPVPMPIAPMYVRQAQEGVLSSMDYKQFVSSVGFYEWFYYNSTSSLIPWSILIFQCMINRSKDNQPSRHALHALATLEKYITTNIFKQSRSSLWSQLQVWLLIAFPSKETEI